MKLSCEAVTLNASVDPLYGFGVGVALYNYFQWENKASLYILVDQSLDGGHPGKGA